MDFRIADTFTDTLASALHTKRAVLWSTFDFLLHWAVVGRMRAPTRCFLPATMASSAARSASALGAAQYQAVTKVSKATATRHLADLVAKGCLTRLPGGGSNTVTGFTGPPPAISSTRNHNHEQHWGWECPWIR